MAPPSSTSFLEEERNCMEWPDKQAPNSVLYVSLGSLASIDKKELEETSWGLANSVQTFLPCFADQLTNARYLTHVLNVGLELENVNDRVVIEKTIKKLMVDNEGNEMRKRVLEMKQKLETSIQKGGSSCRSLNELTEFIFSFPCKQCQTLLRSYGGCCLMQG
ncbi:hypothetical protein ACH5RR_010140 [Cinchona calisaya]|uniref:Uncharacterized protein n=1 Tax=Cinchona calisaya TaxID=153742 RepID=A0ABD3AGV7_9GENT